MKNPRALPGNGLLPGSASDKATSLARLPELHQRIERLAGEMGLTFTQTQIASIPLLIRALEEETSNS